MQKLDMRKNPPLAAVWSASAPPCTHVTVIPPLAAVCRTAAISYILYTGIRHSLLDAQRLALPALYRLLPVRLKPNSPASNCAAQIRLSPSSKSLFSARFNPPLSFQNLLFPTPCNPPFHATSRASSPAASARVRRTQTLLSLRRSHHPLRLCIASRSSFSQKNACIPRFVFGILMTFSFFHLV